MPYKEPTVSYIYAEPETWRKFMSAVEDLGWQRSSLLTQMLSSYCAKNRAYLNECADLDSKARGFDSPDGTYYELCRDWENLQQYEGDRPIFPESPMAAIDDIPTLGNRQSYSSIRCSGINSAYLRIITIVERQTVPHVFSRLVVWHFGSYWHRSYDYQISADAQSSFTPTQEDST